MSTDLESMLTIGAKIRIGKDYAEYSHWFEAGEIIILQHGDFEYDNGLYTENQTAPSVWSEDEKDWNSIYHLFGNNLENFMDCEVIPTNQQQKEQL